MTDPSATDQQLEEELVAYLDGELDAAARQLVEQRLSADAEYRARLQRLQQAWSMLDDLPRSGVSPELIQSTVAMVAVTVGRSARSARRSAWLSWAAAGGAVAASGVIAFLTVSHRLGAEERRFLEDLPVIEKVDLYRNVESLEFLRSLDQEGLFGEDDDEA